MFLLQGVAHLQQLMDRFVDSAQDPNSPSARRDGYLRLFIFLPRAFRDEFVPFIQSTLPPILKVRLSVACLLPVKASLSVCLDFCSMQGLADESEFVRDTALLAGQTIINSYADKSVELFVPELEIGEWGAGSLLGGGGWYSRFLSVYHQDFWTTTGGFATPVFSSLVTSFSVSVGSLVRCPLRVLKMTTLARRQRSGPSSLLLERTVVTGCWLGFTWVALMLLCWCGRQPFTCGR